MLKSKVFIYLLLLCTFFSILGSVQISHAASVNDVLNTLTSSTVQSDQSNGTSGGFLGKLFDFLFNKLLGPIFNILGGSSSTSSPVEIKPLPPNSDNSNNGSIIDSGVLKGKTIVIDPGHGGSNPGAVANNVRESDINLAVGSKVRDKLVQAGAKVIMTRSTDRTVASEGKSLGEELQARVDIAEANHADIFVSIHSNYNASSGIQGAMTFYPSNRSSALALEVQSELIKETKAINKGVSSATFYVLRNTSMPSILIEMGFVSNAEEAARLSNAYYQTKIANGIFNGIVKYFTTQ